MALKHHAGRICVALLTLGVLPGCLGGQTRGRAEHTAEAQHAVLAEIGLRAAPVGSETRPAGPSLVAGDAIAWRWAVAFGKAPAFDAPATRFATAE